MSALESKSQIKDKYDFPDLEDCPFCGQKAIRVQNPGSNWDGKEKHIVVGAGFGTWYVGCPAPFFEGILKQCPISPAAKWYANLEDAEQDWNNRVQIKVKSG